MPSKEGMILTDFENWLGHANEDPILKQYPPASIITATASATEHEVRARYPDHEITRRFTAFSSPKLAGANPQEMRAIEEAAEAARQCRYQVETVDRAPDAADYAITQRGIDTSYNRRFGLLVIATQDGGPPWVALLAQMRTRTKVHLIGFDRIPPSFGGEEMLPFTSLKERVFAILTQTPPPVSLDRRISQSDDVRANAPPRTTTAYDPSKTARESTHAFLANPDSVADTRHRAWITHALAYTKEMAGQNWEGTQLQLVRAIRSRWRGPAPPDEILGTILAVIAQRFFYRRTLLVYKPGEMISFLRRFPHLDTTP